MFAFGQDCDGAGGLKRFYFAFFAGETNFFFYSQLYTAMCRWIYPSDRQLRENGLPDRWEMFFYSPLKWVVLVLSYSTLLFLGFDNEIVVCVSTETET